MDMTTPVGLRETLIEIIDGYPSNKNKLSATKRGKTWFGVDIPAAIRSAVDTRGLVVKASAGMGQNASEVPFVGIRKPELAPSFLRGAYVCYLFNTDRSGMVLSLMLGVTKLGDDSRSADYHPNKADIPALRRRRDGLRSLLDIADPFSLEEISLGARLPRGSTYEHGHICGIQYRREAIPNEQQLTADLEAALHLYSSYRPEMLNVAEIVGRTDSLPYPERHYKAKVSEPRSSLAQAYVDIAAWQQALERRTASHSRLLNDIVKSAGVARVHYRDTVHIDLVVSGRFIVEAKSLRGDEVAQARAALAQLYHYRFVYRERYKSPELVAVFDAPLPTELATFLRECNVRVFWKDGLVFNAEANDLVAVPWLR